MTELFPMTLSLAQLSQPNWPFHRIHGDPTQGFTLLLLISYNRTVTLF
jgi:hypothetical protein